MNLEFNDRINKLLYINFLCNIFKLLEVRNIKIIVNNFLKWYTVLVSMYLLV